MKGISAAIQKRIELLADKAIVTLSEIHISPFTNEQQIEEEKSKYIDKCSFKNILIIGINCKEYDGEHPKGN